MKKYSFPFDFWVLYNITWPITLKIEQILRYEMIFLMKGT